MKTGTFEVMEQNEMMAVSGGFIGWTAGQIADRMTTGYTTTAHRGGKKYSVTYTPSASTRKAAGYVSKFATWCPF